MSLTEREKSVLSAVFVVYFSLAGKKRTFFAFIYTKKSFSSARKVIICRYILHIKTFTH